MPNTGNMITSFLSAKICKNKKYKNKADFEFINNSDRKCTGNISFIMCFGHGALLVTVDIENFAFCQQTIADEHNYIKPKRTITAEFDEKYNVYVLNFSLDKFHKETI